MFYIRKVKDAQLRILNKFLSPLENKYLRNSKYPKHAPIFIVGPARSGTTLIYQAFIKRYKTSYFSNLNNIFYKIPLAATHLLQNKGRNQRGVSDFNSSYGKMKGLLAPSQGDRIWRRWFPRNSNFQNMPADDQENLKKTLGGIEEVYSAPFVSKWPAFSVYITTLSTLFPNALFIRVTRNYAEVAKSVLKGRRELWNDENKSISQLPKNIQSFQKADPLEQVCAYVLGIEQQITNDLNNVAKSQIITVKYESFCDAPEQFLEMINRQYISINKTPLKINSEVKIGPFTVSRSKKVTDNEAKKIESCLNKFIQEKRFGPLAETDEA